MENDSDIVLDWITKYLASQSYDEGRTKAEKRAIRKKSESYVLRTGKLFYKHCVDRKSKTCKELLAIRSIDDQRRIVKDVHSRCGDTDTAKSLSGHLGINKTRAKILEQFFWKTIGEDVKDFIKSCDRCQKGNHTLKTTASELHCVPVPTEAMAQIGVDITHLPTTEDGYKSVIVAVDFFSKWTEARCLKDHKAHTVAQFLFEDIICRHGCVKVQINDQGREFVNQVRKVYSKS